MAEDKTSTEIDAQIDALVIKEAEATGLTPEVIKEAVQRERAARAAARILKELESSSTPLMVVRARGF